MENAFFFSIKNTENVVVFGIKHHCDIKIKACTSELAPPSPPSMWFEGYEDFFF